MNFYTVTVDHSKSRWRKCGLVEVRYVLISSNTVLDGNAISMGMPDTDSAWCSESFKSLTLPV